MPKFRDDGHHLVTPVIDWSQDVDKLVANKQFHHVIERAIDELRPVDRDVVVMSDLEEMSNREICEALGLSVQAVKARLHRARLFLREGGWRFILGIHLLEKVLTIQSLIK